MSVQAGRIIATRMQGASIIREGMSVSAWLAMQAADVIVETSTSATCGLIIVRTARSAPTPMADLNAHVGKGLPVTVWPASMSMSVAMVRPPVV